ncbi:hypothetical protein, partial [Xanthomonas fragariae]|uniref:hypothetical protein n=2 Tax=Xanthomonas fragariae TaxID=48664 RepID=UPI0025A13863
ERALEFNAMEHIGEIDTLLQRNAAVLSDQYAQASRARMEEIEQEQSSGNALTQPGMDALRAHGIASSNEGTWDGLFKALLPVRRPPALSSGWVQSPGGRRPSPLTWRPPTSKNTYKNLPVLAS